MIPVKVISPVKLAAVVAKSCKRVNNNDASANETVAEILISFFQIALVVSSAENLKKNNNKLNQRINIPAIETGRAGLGSPFTAVLSKRVHQ